MGTPSERLPRIASFSELSIPSAILGVDQVFAFLAANGLCEFRSCSSLEFRPEDLAWADSIILVRGASQQEARLQKEAIRLRRRTATYLDDDLENIPSTARSALFFHSTAARTAIRSIIQDADLTLVTNEFLGRILENRHKVPTTVLRQPRPAPPPALEPPRLPREAAIRIGFLGSLDHHGFFEKILEKPARQLHAKFGDKIKFVFCGIAPGFAADIGAEVLPYEMDFSCWRKRAASLGIDIGLAPLPISDFHQSKYWNKYLEYGSLGIPGIYSERSPNAEVVKAGRTGLIVSNQPEAWQSAIETLITNDALREEIGCAAALDVEERFSELALESQWRDATEALLAYRAPKIDTRAIRLSHGHWQHWADRYNVYGIRNAIKIIIRRLSRTRE